MPSFLENWLWQCRSSCKESSQGGNYFKGHILIYIHFWLYISQTCMFKPFSKNVSLKWSVLASNLVVPTAGSCFKLKSAHQWGVWRTCSAWKNDWSLRLIHSECKSFKNSHPQHSIEIKSKMWLSFTGTILFLRFSPV